MLKKVKYIFYLVTLFIFVICITSFYFSDQNVSKTNKSRSLYLADLSNDTQNLPLLKNDTSDIIEYRNDIEIYRKNKKNYKFWDLINK